MDDDDELSYIKTQETDGSVSSEGFTLGLSPTEIKFRKNNAS
jgi:hypothetical protein